jgi:hypothetical protein
MASIRLANKPPHRLRILDHPVAISIPPDVQARETCGLSHPDILMNHDITHLLASDPRQLLAGLIA